MKLRAAAPEDRQRKGASAARGKKNEAPFSDFARLGHLPAE